MFIDPRLKKAMVLLSSTKLSSAIIARETGYTFADLNQELLGKFDKGAAYVRSAFFPKTYFNFETLTVQPEFKHRHLDIVDYIYLHSTKPHVTVMDKNGTGYFTKKDQRVRIVIYNHLSKEKSYSSYDAINISKFFDDCQTTVFVKDYALSSVVEALNVMFNLSLSADDFIPLKVPTKMRKAKEIDVDLRIAKTSTVMYGSIKVTLAKIV